MFNVKFLVDQPFLVPMRIAPVERNVDSGFQATAVTAFPCKAIKGEL